MPIPVVCPGCGSRFNVSDKFAGKTGPCPKCRKSITIPTTVASAVTIHEPESPTVSSGGTGRVPTAPIPRIERPVSRVAVAAWGTCAVAAAITALLARWAFQPGPIPPWMLAAAGLVVAIPCVFLGYTAVRDRELEPHSGRSLWIRCLICAAVYAALWCVKGVLPETATAEMWQWLYLGPIFVLPAAVAAYATLDVDWGPAVGHFSLYVMVTAVLRWLAGLPPL